MKINREIGAVFLAFVKKVKKLLKVQVSNFWNSIGN